MWHLQKFNSNPKDEEPWHLSSASFFVKLFSIAGIGLLPWGNLECQEWMILT
jgi:hypothetical protein